MAASERRVLKVILDKANTTYEDDTFDRSNPSGKYVLDVCCLSVVRFVDDEICRSETPTDIQ